MYGIFVSFGSANILFGRVFYFDYNSTLGAVSIFSGSSLSALQTAQPDKSIPKMCSVV